MAAPFVNTHVTHLTRKSGRRRSRSLTLPQSDLIEEDPPKQSMRRKQFFNQIQMTRQHTHTGQQKHHDRENEQSNEDENQPTVTRVSRRATMMSMKKHTSSTIPVKKQMSTTTCDTTNSNEDVHHQEHKPQLARIIRLDSTKSLRKRRSSPSAIPVIVKKQMPTATYNTINLNDDELKPQVTRIIRLDSTKSSKKQISSTTYKSSTLDPSALDNGLNFDSTQTSANPFLTSSTNLITHSDIIDQEFFLNDSKDHARRNDIKNHGSIKISQQEKYYNTHGTKLPARSSASFMAAIIAIVIAVIAFAFGLAALILVLLLRSTIQASLGTNSNSNSSSTPFGSSGVMPTSCSNYTTLNDPTRNVFAVGYPLGCDNTAPFINQTSSVWVRFVGSGGTTLPLTTPGMNICGSEGTGWYAGTMPSSTGMVVNGTACFTWYTSVCRFSVTISVANCGSFYVYKLPPPPACMVRYCTI